MDLLDRTPPPNLGDDKKTSVKFEDGVGRKPIIKIEDEDEEKPVSTLDDSDDDVSKQPTELRNRSEEIEVETGACDFFEFLDGQSFVSDEDETETEPTFKEEEEQTLDVVTDFEKQLRENIPDQAQVSAPAEDNDHSEGQLIDNPWKSSQALVRFRRSAQRVADEYLKAQTLKLKKTPKRSRSIRNPDAYRQGKEDSKRIDVKRRRIEGASAGNTCSCP